MTTALTSERFVTVGLLMLGFVTLGLVTPDFVTLTLFAVTLAATGVLDETWTLGETVSARVTGTPSPMGATVAI
ncbi:hypothetical protein GCM10009563_20760 [Subtercola frigoramans]